MIVRFRQIHYYSYRLIPIKWVTKAVMRYFKSADQDRLRAIFGDETVMLTFKELWAKLTDGDETVMLEAKLASDIGKSIWETISAFSNEPGANGGYFILGVARRLDSLFPDYEVRGIENPDKLQSDFVSQCREMFSSPIRPEINVEIVDENKCVIVAYIPEAPTHQKPIYIKSRGVVNGAFRRIGPTDQKCTEDDLAIFYQSRGSKSYDEMEVSGTSQADVDPDALKLYRSARESTALSQLEDSELLYAVNALADNSKNSPLTLAGLMLFGRQIAIRRHLPMTRVDYIRVEGTEWVTDTEQRYQAVERMGALLVTIPQLINQVLDDIPKAFDLPASDVHRKDKPLIPRSVIREAVVNALMHRNYRVHQPVQIIRFANRVEIINPGYSLIPDERLGQAGSRSRNPKIAAVLHDVGLAETKGTGIKVMKVAMERANLTLPLIESDREKDEFSLRLLVHHLLRESDITWLSRFAAYGLSNDEAKALIILREIGELDNATYRQLNHMDALTASGHLRRLRGLGILEQRGKGASTFYKPGIRFFEPKSKRKPRTEMSAVEPLTDAQRQELAALRQQLSADILAEIDSLKKRVPPNQLNALIERLCNARPLNAAELGLLLNKNAEHLRNRNIKQLFSDGRLVYFYPDQPNHPDQRYVLNPATAMQ